MPYATSEDGAPTSVPKRHCAVVCDGQSPCGHAKPTLPMVSHLHSERPYRSVSLAPASPTRAKLREAGWPVVTVTLARVGQAGKPHTARGGLACR